MTTEIEPLLDQDFDPFKYFEGGKEGIQERYGNGIREGYKDCSNGEIEEICRLRDIDSNQLREILKGNYNQINSEAVQRLSPILFDVSKGFGRPSISPEEESRLIQMANSDGFCAFVGIGDSFSVADRLELYLVTEALRRL